jgi:hypothetical protein
MDGGHASHDLRQPVVAARASAPAFDAKTVSFADHMNV